MTEALFSIEFQMALFLASTVLAYCLSYKLKQSALIAQIVLGIIIGPSVLGIITYSDFLKTIAHFGAIILLFVIGLEFKLQDIAKPKYLVIALFGVLLPWGGGYLFAKAFGYGLGPSLFVGTALTATSIAITANVLKEMRLLESEVAKAIIGAAVIDDILGLLVLAFSEQLVFGNLQLLQIVFIFLKAAGFLLVGALLGMYVFSKGIHLLDRSPVAKQYPELVFITTVLLVFLYSFAAEFFGLSAIVGAFLAGVSLEGVQLINSQSHKHGAEYLYMIFGSIFFVSLGVIVDFRVITSEILIFMSLLTLLALVTKFFGCGISALFTGLSAREAAAVGVGMAPRGEVAMIVALIGLGKGIIEQDIYLSVMVMSIATTIAVPSLLRLLLSPKAESTGTQPLKEPKPFFSLRKTVGGNPMKFIKTAFGVVAVLLVLTAAAGFGLSMWEAVSYTEEKETIKTTMSTGTSKTYTFTAPTENGKSESEQSELDSEREMEYLYLQSQNINRTFSELNEIQEHSYDIMEDYDEVEMDWLQEQVDNERTVAKEYR